MREMGRWAILLFGSAALRTSACLKSLSGLQLTVQGRKHPDVNVNNTPCAAPEILRATGHRNIPFSSKGYRTNRWTCKWLAKGAGVES